jgi:hypothetical protein
MCGNPFKIWEKVDGNFEVEKSLTTILNFDDKKLKWRGIDDYNEVLTLNEIFEQVIEEYAERHIPCIRVIYESAMWGVIFEVGNYSDMGKQWIVHGITKGYA